MKDLLNYLVTNLVKHPEDIQIQESKGGSGEVVLEFRVNPEDTGLVIGKGGKVIRSIRNLLKTKAIIENKKLNLVLLEQ